MGSLNLSPELSFDFKPTFIPKTISQFLAQLTKIGSLSDKVFKVDDFISRLETEMRKIDAFKRELPLCMLLINDAIVALKEELMVLKRSSLKSEPVLEEFIPLKRTCDEEVEISSKKEKSGVGDKKNWLSSTQLWNTNDTNRIENGIKMNSAEQVTKKRVEENDDSYNKLLTNPVRAFIPFKGCFEFPLRGASKEVVEREELQIPALSLNASGINNCFTGNILLAKTSDNSKLIPCAATNGLSNVQTGAPQSQPPHQQASRKQRRCWSTELHRRFVNALQQLGGSQAATPKQIRELMQVDGLTNDEVKSHLQKYRLHTRRLPSSNNSSANQSNVVLGGGLWMSPQDQYVESSKHGLSQSGSPDGPLLIGTTGGTSTTGGESMDDGEDTKSENYCWKGSMHTSGNDDV